jgi:hypothetical protein
MTIIIHRTIEASSRPVGGLIPLKSSRLSSTETDVMMYDFDELAEKRAWLALTESTLAKGWDDSADDGEEQL